MIGYDGSKRPSGNNADEWLIYLQEWGATPMVAVQIAEAIDAARPATHEWQWRPGGNWSERPGSAFIEEGWQAAETELRARELSVLWCGEVRSVPAHPATHEEAEIGPVGFDPTKRFGFTYRNHRGEVAKRQVWPMHLHFGATKWHPEPQWLLRGFDLDKMAERDFAMGDIVPASPSGGKEDDGADEVIKEYLAAIDTPPEKDIIKRNARHERIDKALLILRALGTRPAPTRACAGQVTEAEVEQFRQAVYAQDDGQGLQQLWVAAALRKVLVPESTVQRAWERLCMDQQNYAAALEAARAATPVPTPPEDETVRDKCFWCGSRSPLTTGVCDDCRTVGPNLRCNHDGGTRPCWKCKNYPLTPRDGRVVG